MPKLRPAPEKAPEEYRPSSQVEPRPPREYPFKPGRSKTGGRVRGQPNVVTRSVREGIIAGLNAAGGVGGVADYVTKVALQDHRLGVAMMSLVVPRQANIDVTRNEQMLVTIEDLDRSLLASGLPMTREIFALDFSRGEDTTEAEVVAEEEAAKKL